MTTNINSRPRYEQFGTLDQSTRQPVVEPVTLPQHLPWGPTFAAWGDSAPTVFRGGGATKMYGTETFDETSVYCTHSTPFLNQFNLNTNAILYQRLIPPNATKSLLRLSVEVIKTDVPVYERNNDGSVKYEYNGLNQRVPVVERTIVGHRLVFHVGVAGYPSVGTPENLQSFGNAKIMRDFRANETLGADGEQLGSIANNDDKWSSTLYPIYDFNASYFGAKGDSFGLRTILPTTRGNSPIDAGSVYASKSYMWRLGLVSRDELTGGYNLIQTVGGEGYVDVSLKDNVRTDRAKVPMSIDKVFIPEYKTKATSTAPAFEGPYGEMHLYREAIEELQTLLIVGDTANSVLGEADFNDVAELAHGRVPLNVDTQYLLNFLGGYDVEGVPYYAFETARSANFGGTTFVADTVIYGAGGSDGLYLNSTGEPDELANYELFDSMVRQEMTTFGEGEVRWLNSAKYPVSAFWDSGYSLETKKALLNPIGKRKDVATILATQAVADYVTTNVAGQIKKVWSWIEPNNEAEESSIAGMLRTIASTFPESEVFGTSCCRAIIVGQCGILLNGNYIRKLPLAYELADKVSRFMGAGSGYWDDAAAYDIDNNNIISKMGDINLSWKDAEVADKAWANGLVYAEDYDLNRQFFPAVRTVYNKETSVLNSSITMFAITYIQRVCQNAWRDLVGSAKFTRAAFIQRSNEMISERLAKRFDDRFIIEVHTHFTGADQANGFSWNCRIDVYAPNMLLVGKYTITANRLDDYLAQAA